jgi:hypothetical protein
MNPDTAITKITVGIRKSTGTAATIDQKKAFTVATTAATAPEAITR